MNVYTTTKRRPSEVQSVTEKAERIKEKERLEKIYGVMLDGDWTEAELIEFRELTRAQSKPLEFAKLIARDLRKVRDTQSFKAEGCTCFRAWTMKHFGDKLGIWLDEIL